MHRYDGQNCINTWPFKSGKGPCGDWSEGDAECSHAHRFENNKCLVLYTDVYSPGAGGCPPGTSLSGPISTVLTVLSWICVGIHSRRVLPSPVCA